MIESVSFHVPLTEDALAYALAEFPPGMVDPDTTTLLVAPDLELAAKRIVLTSGGALSHALQLQVTMAFDPGEWEVRL